VLLRDRQQLTRHVEFLQHQLMTATVTPVAVSNDNVSVGDKVTDTERQTQQA